MQTNDPDRPQAHSILLISQKTENWNFGRANSRHVFKLCFELVIHSRASRRGALLLCFCPFFIFLHLSSLLYCASYSLPFLASVPLSFLPGSPRCPDPHRCFALAPLLKGLGSTLGGLAVRNSDASSDWITCLV